MVRRIRDRRSRILAGKTTSEIIAFYRAAGEERAQIMSIFALPIVALGFGAFLLCAETCLHFESLLSLPKSWLSLPIHDWAAGLFLVYAGVRSRRDWVSGRPVQAAAWAFNLSLLYTAFVGHLESWSSHVPDEGWIPERVLVSIIGVLFAVALCGLVSTLLLTNPSWRRDQPS